ncbi:MAG: hypothetical protein ACI9XR_001728 [Flavobacterium sp.]|jgi:uncharacterized protein (DUF1684 family)
MKNILLSVLFGISTLCNAQEKTSKEFQDELNSEYADAKKSPLLPGDLSLFKSLDFYLISEKFIVNAKFVKSKKRLVVKMKTSTNRVPEYKVYGTLFFELEGKPFQLNVYQSVPISKNPEYVDYLFLPFSDLSNGKESYIGGRYIDLKIPNSDTLILDFNKAYNPYCAYSPNYSCPKVPLENDLKVSILAGVKKFHD